MTVPSTSAGELKHSLIQRLRVRVPLANLIGAVLAFVSGALTAAGIRGQRGVQPSDFIVFALFFAVSTPLGYSQCKEGLRRSLDWLMSGRQATVRDQRMVLWFPWRVARGSLYVWVTAAVVWGALAASGHHPWRFTVCLSLSILLGGFTTCGLTYLIVEWTMRPAVALALAGDAPERPIGPGVRTKLVLAWMVGADVFLLLIALTVLGRPGNQPPSRLDIGFIIAAGFAVGTLMLYEVSRSLMTPLLDLRDAVDRVGRGQLDVSLPVNDGGEVGMVQAGFNRMVAGLRERATLHDLFGRHVGDEVARRALAQGTVALGGERREVGVVFVDVIGSTQLAQTRAPEQVVAILNRLFATIVRVVSDEGGWVNKFEGDGALCVFGAPASTDDYAQHALRAARTLRRELLALSMVEPALDAAIGVSAGTAVAGNVGAEQRYEYTVMGSPVNEASRLTTEAKQRLGRVLASEEVITRAGTERSCWKVAAEVTLRGYDHSILAYEPADSVRTSAPA
ncbi:MAG TPA: adenylate/guanylate cyclase domain-containing protein [Mycobacteriales bacterium]|nr:adenylate/guanylate cyclase domain-containing protein [Mycobacteriales bacterium]